MNYSGRFVLRIPAPLHRRLSREAERRGLSLNELCNLLIESNLEGRKNDEEKFSFLNPIVKQLTNHFKDLLGVVVFGSQVTGKATQSSDLDLLIVLPSNLPITRSLYRWWDEEIPSVGPITVNPHFVHLPPSPDGAGSLWLEVATAHEILWERNGAVGDVIKKLLEIIALDRVRRYWSNGQPYWVKSHEEQRPGH